MNQWFSVAFSMLQPMAVAVQGALNPTTGVPMTGDEKAGAVVTAITNTVPDLTPQVAEIKMGLNMMVALLSLFHPLFVKTPPATPAPASTAAASS
jgi:hypothetical protein